VLNDVCFWGQSGHRSDFVECLLLTPSGHGEYSVASFPMLILAIKMVVWSFGPTMRRREFIRLIGGAAIAWPLATRAQQPEKIAKIGYLDLGPASARADRVEALRKGLRDLGYVEGKNIAIEFRWAERAEQLPELAADLVRSKVDVIFAISSTMVEPARKATSTIPIVFATHADPVGIGHVVSLARPGGNITGLSMLLTELVPKELEILTEVVPQAKRIAVLWNPTTPSVSPAMKAVDAAAQLLGLQLVKVPAQVTEDFVGAFEVMAREHAEALMVVASPLFVAHRELLADLALQHRLPAMYGSKEFVQAGGLISYSADLTDLNRRAASYIDKILKGAKPDELPVEQASKFELVINRKTAKAIGLTIPPTLIARADEVIE
jgi:putative tryptophan/tyrosine transport system substrate-binding protein